ncbi:MAG: hypothetical protein Q7T03_03235 [Deltaproteobacteria bacterium]|nr:hypothetical protein [Deltaproteobacteria bacterium]
MAEAKGVEPKNCKIITVGYTPIRYIHGTDIEIQGTITRTEPGCPTEARLMWEAFKDIFAGKKS